MKFTWILVILLLLFVAIFSVQNAEPVTVYFLRWDVTMSAALVIQLAALLGGLVGLAVGAMSRRAPAPSVPRAPSDLSPPLSGSADSSPLHRP